MHSNRGAFIKSLLSAPAVKSGTHGTQQNALHYRARAEDNTNHNHNLNMPSVTSCVPRAPRIQLVFLCLACAIGGAVVSQAISALKWQHSTPAAPAVAQPRTLAADAAEGAAGGSTAGGGASPARVGADQPQAQPRQAVSCPTCAKCPPSGSCGLQPGWYMLPEENLWLKSAKVGWHTCRCTQHTAHCVLAGKAWRISGQGDCSRPGVAVQHPAAAFCVHLAHFARRRKPALTRSPRTTTRRCTAACLSCRRGAVTSAKC